ncbi:hypothetical protein BCR34DRAFT_601354 [Clohesyomyces aquaticus]|uniref:Uncharacterized protein n=1 Tax=Clohesyomyces aquaticus TaxID=1231657 RepID=A0A1Y1ZMC4_9PLEO|nr:hypothetical protein BCR34DRAFT_601354 [Clohesyomyces aquaticus]
MSVKTPGSALFLLVSQPSIPEYHKPIQPTAYSPSHSPRFRAPETRQVAAELPLLLDRVIVGLDQASLSLTSDMDTEQPLFNLNFMQRDALGVYDEQAPFEYYGDFNFQSLQVNNAINFGASTCPTITLNSDISSFIPPHQSPQTPKHRLPKVIVRHLLTPPPHAFLNGVLAINWVVGAAGSSHFEFRDADERIVLTQSSVIRQHGAALGLPRALLGWLCGNDPEFTSTEESMILTPDFFESEVDVDFEQN